MWDLIKCTNIRRISVPEREQYKAESLFKEITENFPNLGRDLDIQIQRLRNYPVIPMPKAPL